MSVQKLAAHRLITTAPKARNMSFGYLWEAVSTAKVTYGRAGWHGGAMMRYTVYPEASLKKCSRIFKRTKPEIVRGDCA
jgi:hypothetical protein